MASNPSNTGDKPADANKKRKDPPQGTNPSKQTLGKDDRPREGGRFHKRVKISEARHLRSQPADAALKDGELDLQAFLNAREYEIKALEDGMRMSKALNNRRAFQLVPRGMRRRTASHNVKKLPRRLRARAMDEKIQDNTPTVEARTRKPRTTKARIRVETAKKLGILAEKKRKRKLRDAKARAKAKEGEGEEKEKYVPAAMRQLIEARPARPKIRRNLLNDPPKPKAKFRKRQIDKQWLPTHLWHTKRASMTPPKEPLWRFAVPLTPTEKVYRPTHRASSAKGAVVWDVSYMSTVGLYGHGAGIERTLRALGMAHDSLWDDRGKKWREGRRKWSGMLTKQEEDGKRQLGPATVIWNPEPVDTEGPEGDPSKSAEKAQRQVYIRLHPSCFLDVFNILVKLIKRETPRLYVEDLRFEIGSIELIGPGSTEALLGIIRPYHTKMDVKEPHAKLFDSMADVNNANTLPSDVVLGFSAQDPRLRYPPRTFQTVGITDDASNTRQDTPKSLADKHPAPFPLFDRNDRFKASCFPSQKALNRRKGSNPSGQPLQPTTADPPFPIILFASRLSATKSTAQETWTLLTPWKCVLPIWYSLVHYPLSTGGNPRVGGLDELRQVTFEQGLPWFPGDFPGTDAGAEWELEQRAKRKAHWERRPKSKRVAWKSLDLGAGRKGEIGRGWACEFERLFGLQQNSEEQDSSAEDGARDLGEITCNEGKDDMDVDKDGVPGASVDQPGGDGNEHQATKKEASKQKQGPHVLTLIQHLSKSAFNTLATSNITDASPPPYSIVTVKIDFIGRGVPHPCARIYRLPSRNTDTTVLPSIQAEVPTTLAPSQQANTLPADLRDQWLAKIPTSSTSKQSSANERSHQTMRIPRDADHNTQKLLLAQSLMTKKVPFPPERTGGNSDHPLVPGEEDLIGYVTKGEFNLAEGKGVAIGCVSVEKVLEALRTTGDQEGRVCVVRNSGETVGWVAKWKIV